MTGPRRENQLERAVTAIETIEKRIGVRSKKRGVSRAAYR
jgi:hypothetical protein